MNATTPEPPPISALLGNRRRRKPWRRRARIAALGCLIAAGWFAVDRYSSAGATAPAYSTQAATRGDVVIKVTSSGTLSPVEQVEVGSQVSGRIAELHADYNSLVKAGDVLAIIDPQTAETAVAQSKARLASARADYQKAKAVAEDAKIRYARDQGLADKGAVSRADADAALTALRSADATVSAALAAITVAKAALKESNVALAYTTIRSPIDGLVISRSVDVGQTVAASLSAPVLFVIAEDLGNMELHTTVAESDVGQLKVGQAVEFTVDAFPDRNFSGEVKQVRYEATTVSNVVTYDTVVAVSNEELLLRPGMTADAAFIIDASRDVLAVPQKALSYRPADARQRRARQSADEASRQRQGEDSDSSQRGVAWVLRDGEPAPVRVVTGLSDGTLVEISAGELEEGELVIISDGASAKTSKPRQQQQPPEHGGGPPRPTSII